MKHFRLLTIALVTASGLATLFNAAPTNGKPEGSSSSPRTASISQPVLSHGYDWQTESGGVWDASFQQSFGELAAGVELDAPKSSGKEIRGELQLKRVSLTDEKVELAAVFLPVDNSDKVFSYPVKASLSAIGQLQGIRVDGKCPAADRPIVKALYTRILSVVAKPSLGDWIESEPHEGTDQTIRAKYRATSTNSFSKVRSVDDSAPRATEPSSSKSDAKLEISASSFSASLGGFWLDNFEGQERETIVVDGHPWLQSTVKIALRRLSGRSPTHASLDEIDRNPDTFDEAASEGEGSVYEQNIAGQKGKAVGPIIERMLSRVANGRGFADLQAERYDLRWNLRANASAATELVAALKERQFPSVATLAIADALTKSASHTGMSVVNSVIAQPSAFPPHLLHQLLQNTSELCQQEGFGITGVYALAHSDDINLSAAAFLAAGTDARINQGRLPAFESLVQKLAGSPYEDDLGLAYDGSRNARSPSLRARAERDVKNPSLELRMAAIDYLGGIPATTSSDAALLQSLADSEQRVVQKAIDAANSPLRGGIGLELKRAIETATTLLQKQNPSRPAASGSDGHQIDAGSDEKTNDNKN